MMEEKMNPKVDAYFAEGCGRCALGSTPRCKAKKWLREFERLRALLLACDLTEEVKWGVPCYMHQKGNVILMSGFKEYCSLSFFKGALMKDPHGILQQPGENTQAARLVRFANVQEVIALEPLLKTYIEEAIELEKSGSNVTFKKISEHEIPKELQQKMDEDAEFKAAFEALTPGRQRGYLLHFSAAKQSKTRAARIEKCTERIFNGKGFNE